LVCVIKKRLFFFTFNNILALDNDAVDELTASLQVDEQGSNERGLILAATFYWHTKQLDKARDLAQKALDAQPNYVPAQVTIS